MSTHQRFRALLETAGSGPKFVIARLPFVPEKVWKTRQDDGKPVHAACVNLGMERSTLSLFRHRRLDANARVAEMRELLQGDARSRMNPRPASLGASA